MPTFPRIYTFAYEPMRFFFLFFPKTSTNRHYPIFLSRKRAEENERRNGGMIERESLLEISRKGSRAERRDETLEDERNMK